MGGSQFVRIYRRVMDRALSPFGFERLGSSFWRVRDRVLHSIVVHRSNPWNFTGEFAIQPLVYPFSTFILNFGDRVDEMEPGRDSWWELPEDREGMERVVQDYAGTVVRYVVPWLERFQTCRDVVEADINGRWELRRLHHASASAGNGIILGLCALAAGMVESARNYLQFACQEYRRISGPNDPEWFKADLRMVEEYLALLDSGDWSAIGQKLCEGEAYTRRSIGLPIAAKGL